METETIIGIATSILALATLFFCLKTAKNVQRASKNDITYALRKILLTITAGYLIWSAAEITYAYLTLKGITEIGTAADLFWILGYAFVITGFLWLCGFIFKQQEELADGALKLAITLLVILFAAANILRKAIIAQPVTAETAYLYFYPLASITLITITITTLRWFSNTALFTPFSLLTAGFGFDLIGDIIYSYAEARSIQELITISDAAYAIGYLFPAIGFYLLTKKRKR